MSLDGLITYYQQAILSHFLGMCLDFLCVNMTELLFAYKSYSKILLYVKLHHLVHQRAKILVEPRSLLYLILSILFLHIFTILEIKHKPNFWICIILLYFFQKCLIYVSLLLTWLDVSDIERYSGIQPHSHFRYNNNNKHGVQRLIKIEKKLIKKILSWVRSMFLISTGIIKNMVTLYILSCIWINCLLCFWWFCDCFFRAFFYPWRLKPGPIF